MSAIPSLASLIAQRSAMNRLDTGNWSSALQQTANNVLRSQLERREAEQRSALAQQAQIADAANTFARMFAAQREAEKQRAFQAGEGEKTRSFQSGESALDRASQEELERSRAERDDRQFDLRHGLDKDRFAALIKNQEFQHGLASAAEEREQLKFPYLIGGLEYEQGARPPLDFLLRQRSADERYWELRNDAAQLGIDTAETPDEARLRREQESTVRNQAIERGGYEASTRPPPEEVASDRALDRNLKQRTFDTLPDADEARAKRDREARIDEATLKRIEADTQQIMEGKPAEEGDRARKRIDAAESFESLSDKDREYAVALGKQVVANPAMPDGWIKVKEFVSGLRAAETAAEREELRISLLDPALREVTGILNNLPTDSIELASTVNKMRPLFARLDSGERAEVMNLLLARLAGNPLQRDMATLIQSPATPALNTFRGLMQNFDVQRITSGQRERAKAMQDLARRIQEEAMMDQVRFVRQGNTQRDQIFAGDEKLFDEWSPAAGGIVPELWQLLLRTELAPALEEQRYGGGDERWRQQRIQP